MTASKLTWKEDPQVQLQAHRVVLQLLPFQLLSTKGVVHPEIPIRRLLARQEEHPGRQEAHRPGLQRSTARRPLPAVIRAGQLIPDEVRPIPVIPDRGVAAVRASVANMTNNIKREISLRPS